jgi:REP element-mobilizing transposase RayT
MDRLLDEGRVGPTWLRRPEIAEMVVSVMEFAEFKLKQFEAHAYVIMSNHVHLLATPAAPLPKMMHSIKRESARRANAMLGLADAFWAEESFDRTVRSKDEFERVRAYIENNPVRAGLAPSPDQFRWSSAWKADS